MCVHVMSCHVHYIELTGIVFFTYQYDRDFFEEITKYNLPTSGSIFGGYSVLTLQMSNLIHQSDSLSKSPNIFLVIFSAYTVSNMMGCTVKSTLYVYIERRVSNSCNSHKHTA